MLGRRLLPNKMLRYTTTFLHSLGKPNNNNLNLYHLNRAVRTWAIAIGIRKPQIECPYRRSQAGSKFFHQIHSWITENTLTKNAAQLDHKQVIVLPEEMSQHKVS